MVAEHHKDPQRVAAGLKASINNPNVSEEAKERATERLGEIQPTELGTHTIQGRRRSSASDHDNRVLGGYKATLKNENVSEQAKAHAREVLEAAGYTMERQAGVSEDEHHIRVLAGYKAALSNPRVSEGGKAHAREFLKSQGVTL